jgi:NAD-dependent deacetylase
VTHDKLVLEPGTRVFVLTGAGISAESGISTFRDANGLWEKYPVETVASPRGWEKDAALVWRFYSERRAQAKTCHPNPAHFALAELERRLGDDFFLCTQNVDSLHEKAGSKRVVHMHGELFKSRCEDPTCPAGAPFDDHALYLRADEIARCSCGLRIRPHICWFGEVPFEMGRIAAELARANVFLTVGTSGAVYPAAAFVSSARAHGARTIYVGPEPPDNADAFDELRLGKAGEVLPALLAPELL